MPLNQIEILTITELLGKNFYIREYQRGYRWTKNNVLQLLNDIWEYRQDSHNQHTFYCLQPLVVREDNWKDIDGNPVKGFEVIDGQQRLTTIHRILTFILLERYGKVDLVSRGYSANLYSIYYATRLESKTFLEGNGEDHTKPDLYYMSEAYKCIKEWFYDTKRGIPDDVMDDVRRILLPPIKEKGKIPEWSVQAIWYEIKDENEKSEDLFKRLNRGKIPLTSAELIKAKFVNTDAFNGLAEDTKIKRKTQLIQIWDEIEHQLNNPKFWAFISNENAKDYSNKIDYLFNIKTGKEKEEKDPLYSFIHFFDPLETADTLWQKWIEIEEIYRSLVYWYINKNFYHKIGYLIATRTPIRKLAVFKTQLTRTDFENKLNELIAETIPDDWEDLTYSQKARHDDIKNVLLLANIEITRISDNSNDFFPFDSFKKISRSLEHIHAQDIEELDPNKQELWINWLTLHTSVLPNIVTPKNKQVADQIIDEVEKLSSKIKYADFKRLSEKILQIIPQEANAGTEYLHKMENMALLGSNENSALNNSIFEVKRRKIIEMDKKGQFIPLATKRIFLKYYATDNTHHFSIWTKQERAQYLKELQNCINTYKPLNTDSNA